MLNYYSDILKIWEDIGNKIKSDNIRKIYLYIHI